MNPAAPFPAGAPVDTDTLIAPGVELAAETPGEVVEAAAASAAVVPAAAGLASVVVVAVVVWSVDFFRAPGQQQRGCERGGTGETE